METIDVGSKIRAFRESKGMSLDKLAAKAEISRDHLGRIERGDNPNPGVKIVEKLAHALNISITDFFEDSLPVENQ